jgi:hypothetical protein
MADPVNPTPTFIDYTSRDYYSLREDLILRVKESLPAWNGDDPADFGVALVESFAYMGDVVNYYIDRVANESYLPTATQRQSILNIAANYGYVPAGYRAASLSVQFTNEAESAVVLPAGTELLANVTVGDTVFDLIYTIPTTTTVPAAVGETVGEITTTAFNYEDIASRPENAAQSETDIAGELVGTSTGQPDQVYRLADPQVIEDSVLVYVQSEEVFEPWTVVPNLIDYGPFDSVVTVTNDANDFTYITFGDGVSGRIPPRFSIIKTTYKVGGSSIGNIATNLVNELFRIPGLTDAQVASLSTTLTVTNSTPGVGGEAPEDDESIKENAPKALTALNRAVSLNDFAALALQVPDVGKAKAVADTYSSVTVYVAPQRNVSSVDQFPGYTENPNDGGVLLQEWYDIQSDIAEFLTNKTLIGTSVTISPPTYVEVSLEVFYTKFDQFQEVTLETNILKSVLDYFAYNNSEFGQVIHPEEIEAFIRSITGVRNARVNALYRTADSSERDILIGEPNEIFVFLTDNIVISPLSSNANLLTLAASPGTLAPTFSPTFYTYSLVVPDGTTSITVVGDTQSDTSTLTVNGAPAVSESSVNVATPVGVTNVLIGVRAADGLVFNTYTIAVTRNA